MLQSLALAAAPSALGFAGSLFGRNKYKDDAAYKGYQSLYNTFSDEIAKPYMETSGAKSVLQAIREANDSRLQRITAAQAVNGMTDEAKIGAMGSIAGNEANAIAGLAGNADNYRMQMLGGKMNSLSGMMGIRDQYRQRSRQQINDIVTPFSQAVQGFNLSEAIGQMGNMPAKKPS